MKSFLFIVWLIIGIPLYVYSQEWEPKTSKLVTAWAEDVSPDNVLQEYPRPQMERSDWLNLNGLWDYKIAPTSSSIIPDTYDGKILVPFGIESALSGVMTRLNSDERILYRRYFQIPETWNGKKILLHFGAVDWVTMVIINNHELGYHFGGYDAFSYDITPYLLPDEDQEIIIKVSDPSDEGFQPVGKQKSDAGGIWYTPTSGIWQTVWLEPVHYNHIKNITIVPNVNDNKIKVTIFADNSDDCVLKVLGIARSNNVEIGRISGGINTELEIPIPSPRLWCPDDPFLYDLDIFLFRDGMEVDRIKSYFGLRKIELKTIGGVKRIFLNNEQIFQIGPLDQGFWPDGLYTAPTDEALKWDIEKTKEFGFNMVRKHVKIEPERWYYWADKLGVLVWQDMPSMPSSKTPTSNAKSQFEYELTKMIQQHFNHPSIVLWVVFNEGWGQYDSEDVTDLVMGLDSARLVCCASGWNDYPVGHIKDAHNYPQPVAPAIDPNRAGVLGEFWGMALKVDGHIWDENSWGYYTVENAEELVAYYDDFMKRIFWLEDNRALNAAVVTQLTDVEKEINGLITYDRKVIKPIVELFVNSNKGVHLTDNYLLPTSEDQGITWKYIKTTPPENWNQLDYDDSGWNIGIAGFGEAGTPGTESSIRTTWTSGSIYLRKTFEVEDLTIQELSKLKLKIHHDDDVWIYINGILIANCDGWTSYYTYKDLGPNGISAIKPDTTNLIAVKCTDNSGGNYIDVGLVFLPSTSTEIVMPQENENLPKKYDLCQNYPNPFNSLTTIEYKLSSRSNVNLSIININGQIVEILVNEIQNTGAYTVEWNAHNHPSGIYFYMVQAGDYQQVKKCLLVK